MLSREVFLFECFRYCMYAAVCYRETTLRLTDLPILLARLIVVRPLLLARLIVVRPLLLLIIEIRRTAVSF